MEGIFCFCGVSGSELPLVAPTDDRHAVLELNGQPDVTGIARMTRPPHIGHEDILAVDGEDEGALSLESPVGFRTTGPQMVGAENMRASLGSQPVQPEVIIQ